MKPGVKSWKTLSDETLLKAVAGWNWLHEYCSTHHDTHVGIGASKMSRLMLGQTIVQHNSSKAVYGCMSNYCYAALGVKLRSLDIAEGRIFSFNDEPLEFLYMIDPVDWIVIPFEATRLPKHGIVMQQSADPMPLMRHTLRQPRPQHSLTDEEIAKFVKHLNLTLEAPSPASTASRPIVQMFTALAKHFNPEDYKVELDLYLEAWGAVDDTNEQLCQDPLMEIIYDVYLQTYRYRSAGSLVWKDLM